MMTDDSLERLATANGISSVGRTEIWQERMRADRQIIQQLDTFVPATDLRAGSDDGLGRSHPHPFDAQLHRPASWDRTPGESITDRVEYALERIAAQSDLNAFTQVFAHEALNQARALDQLVARGESIGPLGGAIVAVKDLMAVRGHQASAGLSSFAPAAKMDAAVVARMRSAGAIVIGATNLHALAYGPFSTSSHFGPVRNPLNTAVVAGGSSGGSAAAVAAGLADIAIGTDTAGSIRMPAALCGVVGFKPTSGLIPTAGLHPLAPSLDHVGPLADSVAEVRLACQVMLGLTSNTAAGNTPRMPPAWGDHPLSGVKVGLPVTPALDELPPEMASAHEQMQDLLRQLGATLLPVQIPTLTATVAVMLSTIGAEAFQTHRGLLARDPERLPEDVRLRLEAGMFITDADYERAQRLRDGLRAEVDSVLRKVNILMTPTMPCAAPLISSIQHPEQAGPPPRMNTLVLPFNLTGHPALSLPFAFDQNGAGIGMQLIGARFGDDHLLRSAASIEHGVRHQ